METNRINEIVKDELHTKMSSVCKLKPQIDYIQ